MARLHAPDERTRSFFAVRFRRMRTRRQVRIGPERRLPSMASTKWGFEGDPARAVMGRRVRRGVAMVMTVEL